MRQIVYDIAVSIDGYIAGPEHTIEGFLQDGEHVRDYFDRLKSYDTVIMGRNTYEFGYKYGLKPGERAYPHMRHYLFSRSLPFGTNDQVTVVRDGWLEQITDLKSEPGSEIYLCGGGQFAGLLLENRLIDKLILKVNPIVLGSGIRLFEAEHKPQKWRLVNEKAFDYGARVVTYEL